MKTGSKPRKINTQLLEQIEFQASRGLSQQQICCALGISETWWNGAGERTRTPNPQIRSLMLYPVELRPRRAR